VFPPPPYFVFGQVLDATRISLVESELLLDMPNRAQAGTAVLS
jgi:hypothetical protein